MFILSARDTLERLNNELERPMTRQNFNASVLPTMAAANHAKKVAGVWIVAWDKLPKWTLYLQERERRINSGEWSPKRLYNLEDFYSITDREE